MLRSLIEFFVRQPVLTVFGAIAIAAIGGYCAMIVPIDAIPNVGENQVIVFTEWPGRSPKDVEDQVTYPLTTAMLSVPGATTVLMTQRADPPLPGASAAPGRPLRAPSEAGLNPHTLLPRRTGASR